MSERTEPMLRLVKTKPGVKLNKYATNHTTGYCGGDMNQHEGMAAFLEKWVEEGRSLRDWYVLEHPPGPYAPPKRTPAVDYVQRSRQVAFLL